MITWLPFIVYMVNEMVIRNGWLLETDILFGKPISYSHHNKNLFEEPSRWNSTRRIKVKEKTGVCSNLGGL